MGTHFTPMPEYPGFEINRSGIVRPEGGDELTVHLTSGGREFVTLRVDGKQIHRSVNVLLRETFGPGAAEAAGYEEPNMKKVEAQRELGKRSKGRCKSGQTYVPAARTCHDCGKPTNNYRCDECWRKVRGFGMEGTGEYHTDLYGV